MALVAHFAFFRGLATAVGHRTEWTSLSKESIGASVPATETGLRAAASTTASSSAKDGSRETVLVARVDVAFSETETRRGAARRARGRRSPRDGD